ncbi:hypothetical protein GOBAR_DD11095 [Gossypium barbadense]|nr:hypothetical protein GOBAR_DD11095 [Gossypium barbadense]
MGVKKIQYLTPLWKREVINQCVMDWEEGTKVEIKNYSDHIGYLINLDNNKFIRFTGFYGNVDPNKRQSSWDMLRKVEKPVKKKWIIGGDFNAILDNMEK